MKLISVSEVPRTTAKGTKAGEEAINNFILKGMSCAKVIFYPDECKSPFTMYVSMSNYSKKMNLPVKVTFRGNDVYLTRCGNA